MNDLIVRWRPLIREVLGREGVEPNLSKYHLGLGEEERSWQISRIFSIYFLQYKTVLFLDEWKKAGEACVQQWNVKQANKKKQRLNISPFCHVCMFKPSYTAKKRIVVCG